MKKVTIFLSLIALVGGTIALGNGPTTPDTPKLGAFKVMSFNVRRKGKEKKSINLWHNRLPEIRKLLNSIQPDIIGFQEATREQTQDLKKVLPHFAVFGTTRGASWGGMGTDEGTPIFYDTRKFTLLKQETFLLNSKWGLVHRKTMGLLPRICTMGKFRINGTNQEFYLYNTHFDNKFPQARITCANSVVAHINKYTGGLPVIVTGDFNTSFSGQIKTIFSKFKHAKRGAKTQSGPLQTSTGWNNDNLKWIDHILVKPQTKVLNYSVIKHTGKIRPSDHRPCVAEIVL